SIAFHPHNGEPGTQRTSGIRIPAPKLLQSATCDDMHAGSRGHALAPGEGDPADALALVLHNIWASAASAWGSQKVMSMARYRSIAVESSACACSRWPGTAYRLPGRRGRGAAG